MTPDEETGRRFCMLSEFMFGKPVFESYKSLCSKIGDETISYQEFDFWFHRFAQGKLNLSYDRSLDSKPKELSDMPIDIIEKVADYFSHLDRLIVRNVSRSLRTLVDNRIARYDYLQILTDTNTVHVEYDFERVEYEKQEKDCWMTCDGVNKLFEGIEPFDLAVEHLSIVFHNPELKLRTLTIVGGEEDDEEKGAALVETALQGHKLVVSELSFYEFHIDPFHRLLRHIEPGTLKRIRIDRPWLTEEDDAMMKEIVEMDQWKQAKCFCLKDLCPIPVDSVIHADTFYIRVTDVSPQEIVRIREALFKSPKFNECRLFTRDNKYDPIAIQEALGPSITKKADRPNWKFYAIPDSTSFLLFIFNDSFVSIKRWNSDDF